MNEYEKRGLLEMCIGMAGNSGIYNHYSRDTVTDQGTAMAISTNNNSTAVQRPYWEQSTTAAPKQYGYDSDDESAIPSAVDQYKWPNPDVSDDGMRVDWDRLWNAWQLKRIAEEEDLQAEATRAKAAAALELAEARAQQRQLVEQLINAQNEAQRIRDAAKIDKAIVPAPTPTEVAPIEDELRPLRFLPLVIPK